MELTVFLFVSLVQILQTQGSGVESKFFKLGADVGLDVKKPVIFTPHSDIFNWKVNTSFAILRSGKNQTNTYIYPDYEKRVELLKNFSLRLRNVQEPDAGLYTAVLSGKEIQLATYQVHIQAAVSPVKLEVVSVWPDSDSCNLTVTCRTDKTHRNATFRCWHDNCTQDGGELSDADWRLGAFVFNSSIVCEQSNRVSKSQEAKTVQQVCRQRGATTESSIFTWIWIPGVLGLGLALALIIKFALKRRQRRATRRHDVSQSNPAQNVDAKNINNDVSLDSTYSLVGYHTGPGETMYAQVVRPAKPKKMLEADSLQVPGHNNNPLSAL